MVGQITMETRIGKIIEISETLIKVIIITIIINEEKEAQI